MAASDSFSLTLNQVISDLNCLTSNFKQLIFLVGAWYTLRFTVQLGSCVFSWVCDVKNICLKKNSVKHYGNWAIVTGCTSGIGKAFAHELAAKGHNIVLISRNKEDLNLLTEHLELNYGVHVIPVTIDFEKTSSYSLKAISDIAETLDVGILVNNVGVHYEYPMEFHHLSEKKVNSLVQVNMASAVAMTHLVLPSMISRRKGLIVFMSSAAASLPFSLISLYSSTKVFLTHFSLSLHDEMKQHNVHVQSLVPYYINTRMVGYSSLLQFSKLFTPSPTTYARNAVKTFGLYKVNTGYFPHTVQSTVQNLFPNFLTLKFSYWLHRRLNAEGIAANKRN